MVNEKLSFLKNIADYYAEKVTLYGETPKGVDWNGFESQHLRFEQLIKVIQSKDSVSINDLGCGYGAFYDFISEKYSSVHYCGFDVSDAMISSAKERFINKSNVRFIREDKPDQIANYTIASGIFNVRLDCSDDIWIKHIEDTLRVMDRYSSQGFAFNCLTAYSDKEKMKKHLYYANPSDLFDFCKSSFSRNVALLHDYDLYEFTILVRK